MKVAIKRKTDKHTHNRFTALRILSGTTWVSRYQKKHSPTHIHKKNMTTYLH